MLDLENGDQDLPLKPTSTLKLIDNRDDFQHFESLRDVIRSGDYTPTLTDIDTWLAMFDLTDDILLKMRISDVMETICVRCERFRFLHVASHPLPASIQYAMWLRYVLGESRERAREFIQSDFLTTLDALLEENLEYVLVAGALVAWEEFSIETAPILQRLLVLAQRPESCVPAIHSLARGCSSQVVRRTVLDILPFFIELLSSGSADLVEAILGLIEDMWVEPLELSEPICRSLWNIVPHLPFLTDVTRVLSRASSFDVIALEFLSTVGAQLLEASHESDFNTKRSVISDLCFASQFLPHIPWVQALFEELVTCGSALMNGDVCQAVKHFLARFGPQTDTLFAQQLTSLITEFEFQRAVAAMGER